MPISTRIKVGNSLLITISAGDEKELIEKASFFGELPCKCGKCGGGNIAFKYRKATSRGKDYDFYELTCKDCDATYSLGQRMDGGLYPRGNKETGEWDEKYVASDRDARSREPERREAYREERGNERRPAPRPSQRNSENTDREIIEDDDIPF